jgi:hypothetical protein
LTNLIPENQSITLASTADARVMDLFYYDK